MPRNGQLTNEEKARAVLARTGQPGNLVAGCSETEIDALAAIYDECVAPEALLAERVDAFWGARRERLESQKATVES